MATSPKVAPRLPPRPVDEHEAKIDLGIVGLGPAEHIGRGGFADVYRAEQLSLRRTVAVKVLRAQASDPDAEARFERECHAIGAVSDHPHIVGVHEGGFTRNGRAYLVMEYLPGGSLYERLVDDGPLSVPEIVDIGIKIGKALAVAHRTGVLHRDVKPANIMISAYGEPALGDFGIARVEGGHQTATGLVTASFAHAAPEVLEGHPPTAAADVYSLGSTMFELMTGQAPYYSPNDQSIWPLMKRILSEPMPSPESVGMSQQFGAVFSRATNRDVAERYSDAEELVEDLIVVAADPAAVVVTPPASGGFVPAPRPPGGQKAKAESSGGTPVGVPDWLPPSAKPDLTLLRPPDDQGVAAAEGIAAAEGDAGTVAFGSQASSGARQLDPTEDFDAQDWRSAHPDLFGSEDRPDSVLWGTVSSPPATAPMAAPALDQTSNPDVTSAPPPTPTPLVPVPVPVPGQGQEAATTMDLPPAVSAGGTNPKSRGWLIPVVGLLAAAAAVVGGLFVFTDLGDTLDPDSGSFSTGSAAATGDTATGDMRIAVQSASVGPLVEGESYDVVLTDVQPGASLQLIIDGLPTGETVTAANDGSVRFEASAGRHSVAVEASTDTGREVSNTVGFYALAVDGPVGGYRATLASVATGGGAEAWAEALAAYDRLTADGHESLELIVSDEAPALTPGYWVVSATGFGADAAAAESYCQRFELATPTDCYVSFVDSLLS